ncbi:MAG: hypothetical protein JRI34_02290 [Deltaproteobacteria bacterium]|nr:hypothetical protein [Deltaproteobacteria bacterium]
MSKARKRSDPRQANLFDYLDQLKREIQPDEASLICGHRIKKLIAQSIKESDYSRIQIANRMSEQLGVEITQAQLDAWTAESKNSHRFPLEYLPLFVNATESWTLIIEACRMCGGHFAKGKEILHVEMGKIKEIEAQLKERKKAIEKLLADIDK